MQAQRSSQRRHLSPREPRVELRRRSVLPLAGGRCCLTFGAGARSAFECFRQGGRGSQGGGRRPDGRRAFCYERRGGGALADESCSHTLVVMGFVTRRTQSMAAETETVRCSPKLVLFFAVSNVE